ncbi:hypothetical protein PX52LOC_06483 [Limnoglobus roseus]|uniref:Uncharacterized protein n=1 Tax=Limnoglobus roseus TaxID=2598579 RepID=A0A5C1ANT6_9BACT|nr:hypothetical protein PX52LOC_06483 [Limnoglobus roseus]
MGDHVRVTGPVEVEAVTVASVAFRLMETVAAHEKNGPERQSREYWFRLYHQCWIAVNGGDKPAGTE